MDSIWLPIQWEDRIINALPEREDVDVAEVFTSIDSAVSLALADRGMLVDLAVVDAVVKGQYGGSAYATGMQKLVQESRRLLRRIAERIDGADALSVGDLVRTMYASMKRTEVQVRNDSLGRLGATSLIACTDLEALRSYAREHLPAPTQIQVLRYE